MENKTFKELILRNTFFKDLTKRESKKINLSYFNEVIAGNGEKIILEGNPGNEIFLLLEGDVTIRKRLSDSSENDIGIIKEGDFFGEMAVIESRERSASVISKGKCTLASISKKNFLSLIKDYPSLLSNIANVMAHRLRESDILITDMKERNLQLEALNKEIKKKKRELEKQKRELEKLNETKDRFFTIISHDLKTPITTIGGISSLLTETAEAVKPEQIREYTEIITTASSELSCLLNNLLEWSLSQGGKLKFKPESHNVKEVTNQSIAPVLPDSIAKKISITTKIDKDLIFTFDENMLSTVIRNIVSNAVKFTNSGGEINISASKSSNCLLFKISDTGIGIKPEQLENIFTVGKSSRMKGTSGETGAGIGLALSKDFINAHNGEIWIESDNGKGTTVNLNIPKNKVNA